MIQSQLTIYKDAYTVIYMSMHASIRTHTQTHFITYTTIVQKTEPNTKAATYFLWLFNNFNYIIQLLI